MPNAETQLKGFYENYEPALAKLAGGVRAKLRARLPGLLELVYLYERQSAFVIAYSPTGNGSAGVCGVSLYPDRVCLFFTGGDQLSKADPKGLLEGKGKMARQLLLNSMADFDRPEIEALIAAAVEISKVRLDPQATGATIVKAEAQKQRATRAVAKAAKPASKTAKPASKIAKPASKIAKPASKTAKPAARTANPVAKTAKPASKPRAAAKPRR